MKTERKINEILKTAPDFAGFLKKYVDSDRFVREDNGGPAVKVAFMLAVALGYWLPKEKPL